MSHTFQELGLHPTLLKTLREMGYEEPTPIQEQAIPHLLEGRDVLGQAQTGTGKTAAFSLPTLQQLGTDGLQVLILTPTRELAGQVSRAVYDYGKGADVRVLPIYGGQSYSRQERRLEKGVHVVVGTPGRTLDLIKKGTLDTSEVRFVILDEADEMLKLGFIEDVETILSTIDADTRQTIFFSATFSKPILKLAEQFMRNPVQIKVEAETVTGENIEQRYYVVRDSDKMAALSRLLEVEPMQNTLIFTRTKAGSAELADALVEQGYPAAAIHGDLQQQDRERILRRFRNGYLTILVATDVVGRGVDIPEVSHVINYDIPELAIQYVHRIGRTGRAGRTGVALTLISPKQRYTLNKIEKYTRQTITKTQLPSLDDVLNARDEDFKNKVLKQLEHANTDHAPLVEEMLASDFTPHEIVNALVQMLRAQESKYALQEIRAVHEKSDRRDRRDRNDRRDRKDRDDRRSNGNRRRGRRNDNPRQSREKGMVRLKMHVGRDNGLRGPGDVVYNIASGANIPGAVIGAIDIHAQTTYVDVPEDHVNDVLKRLKRGKIRGQAMNLERA